MSVKLYKFRPLVRLISLVTALFLLVLPVSAISVSESDGAVNWSKEESLGCSIMQGGNSLSVIGSGSVTVTGSSYDLTATAASDFGSSRRLSVWSYLGLSCDTLTRGKYYRLSFDYTFTSAAAILDFYDEAECGFGELGYGPTTEALDYNIELSGTSANVSVDWVFTVDDLTEELAVFSTLSLASYPVEGDYTISYNSITLERVVEPKNAVLGMLHLIYEKITGQTVDGVPVDGVTNDEIEEGLPGGTADQEVIEDFENQISDQLTTEFDKLDLDAFQLSAGVLTALSWITGWVVSFFDGFGELKVIVLLPMFLGLALLFIGRGALAMVRVRGQAARRNVKNNDGGGS